MQFFLDEAGNPNFAEIPRDAKSINVAWNVDIKLKYFGSQKKYCPGPYNFAVHFFLK